MTEVQAEALLPYIAADVLARVLDVAKPKVAPGMVPRPVSMRVQTLDNVGRQLSIIDAAPLTVFSVDWEGAARPGSNV